MSIKDETVKTVKLKKVSQGKFSEYSRLIMAVILVNIICITGLFWFLNKSKQKSSQEIPAYLETLGSQLKDRGLYKEAARAYEDIIGNSENSIDSERLAGLEYKAGEIYHKYLDDLHSALFHYLKARAVHPESNFSGELNRRIVECFEKIGNTREATRELRTSTALIPEKKAPDDEVVAEIGKEKIYNSQIKKEFDKIPDYAKAQYMEKGKKIEFLKHYIVGELLYRKGLREKMEESPQFAQKIEEMKKRLIVESVYEREVSSGVQISQADVKLFYHENPKEFSVPEKRSFNLIPLKNQNDFNLLIQKTEKESYEKIFEEFSSQPGKLEKFSFVSKTQESSLPEMSKPSEILKKVFSLSAEKKYHLISLDSSYYAVYLKEIQPSVLKSFEEVKELAGKGVQAHKREQASAQLFQKLVAAEGIKIFDGSLNLGELK